MPRQDDSTDLSSIVFLNWRSREQINESTAEHPASRTHFVPTNTAPRSLIQFRCLPIFQPPRLSDREKSLTGTILALVIDVSSAGCLRLGRISIGDAITGVVSYDNDDLGMVSGVSRTSETFDATGESSSE
jgi:hypothetical protein